MLKIWNLIEKIVYSILSVGFKVLGKDLSDEFFESFMQFVRFGIVGVSNSVISYVIYAVSLIGLKHIPGLIQYDYIIAQIIVFILSVLWSFYWNNKLVFVLEKGKKRNMWKALLKTYISYSFSVLFLNSILLILWIQVLGISEFVAPIINLIIGVPVNFFINKLWAFKAE